MNAYRYQAEHTAPKARQITDVAISRFEHVFEVDPSLMTAHVLQQIFPNWDTLRIVRARADYLDWVHRHWCDEVISGAAVLRGLEGDTSSAQQYESGLLSEEGHNNSRDGDS